MTRVVPSRLFWHGACFVSPRILRSIVSIRIVACFVWLAVAGAGFALIANYQSGRGNAGHTALQWPSAANIPLDHSRPTLVMFVHPKCPCSSASMEELNRLLAQCAGRVAPRVLFFKPAGEPESWARTGLWRSAAAMPHVVAQEDPDGKEARLFGAETSGYVALYDTHGRLLFSGGITGSRGHAGDNAGESAVAALLNGQPAGLAQTPVYGCSLLGDCQAPPSKPTK
jgi:hypothetical protein